MKSIKLRIYPNKEQIHFLNGQFGAVRMIYNKGIAIIFNRYKKHNELVSAFTLKKLLPIAKKSRKYHWLKLYDSVSLQESLRNLDKAFKDFYKIQKKHPILTASHALKVDIMYSIATIALMYSIVKTALKYQK